MTIAVCFEYIRIWILYLYAERALVETEVSHYRSIYLVLSIIEQRVAGGYFKWIILYKYNIYWNWNELNWWIWTMFICLYVEHKDNDVIFNLCKMQFHFLFTLHLVPSTAAHTINCYHSLFIWNQKDMMEGEMGRGGYIAILFDM